MPGGTGIAYCAWGVYRSKKDFGEDAEIFRPERWLECGEDKRADMQKVLDLVFGYGKNGCLGKPVALMELGKAIAEVGSLSGLINWLSQPKPILPQLPNRDNGCVSVMEVLICALAFSPLRYHVG